MDKKDSIFWTDILADHAEFLINAFSPCEEANIREAANFHSVFERHHKAAQTAIDSTILNTLKNDVTKFIEFKQNIIAELMKCNIIINFTPGLINHMVNEAYEFLSLLAANTSYPEKSKYPATYIKMWIADVSVHTSSILASLDPCETLLLESTQHYKQELDHIYKKSSELEMIQNNLGESNYQLLKSEAVSTLEQFTSFCRQLSTLLSNCNILAAGTFNSSTTNHYIKEQEYAIRKITTCL